MGRPKPARGGHKSATLATIPRPIAMQKLTSLPSNHPGGLVLAAMNAMNVSKYPAGYQFAALLASNGSFCKVVPTHGRAKTDVSARNR